MSVVAIGSWARKAVAGLREGVSGLPTSRLLSRPRRRPTNTELPMSILIRGGTVVNHDHSRRADVLIDGETSSRSATKLDAPTGAEIVDAGGCYVMPGGIDPHTHMELHVHGHRVGRRFRMGHQGGALRRHHDDRRFLHPAPGAIHARGLSGLARAKPRRRRATTPSTWRSPGGRSRSATRWRPSSRPMASTPSSISWPTRAR